MHWCTPHSLSQVFLRGLLTFLAKARHVSTCSAHLLTSLCEAFESLYPASSLSLTPFCDWRSALVEADKILKLVLQGNPMNVVICSCLSNQESQYEFLFTVSPLFFLLTCEAGGCAPRTGALKSVCARAMRLCSWSVVGA